MIAVITFSWSGVELMVYLHFSSMSCSPLWHNGSIIIFVKFYCKFCYSLNNWSSSRLQLSYNFEIVNNLNLEKFIRIKKYLFLTIATKNLQESLFYGLESNANKLKQIKKKLNKGHWTCILCKKKNNINKMFAL